jgi:hypothetical protein
MERGRLSKLVPRFAIAPVNSNISYTTKIKPLTLTKVEVEDELKRAEKLPTYFNWADQFSAISSVYSQGMCGSCWAVSVASCLSDVFAIKNGTENPQLSPTYLLSCHPQSRCDGGDPNKAVEDIKNNGIGSMNCVNENWCAPLTGCGGNISIPFDPKEINTMIPSCTETKCDKKYYISDAKLLCSQPDLSDFNSIEKEIIQEYFSSVDSAVFGLDYKQVQMLIKRHIYVHGPAIGGFHVFNNFFRDDFAETNQIYVETQNYRGVPGVDYKDVEKTWSGSHAVVIVGWGREKVGDEDVDYWIARNSWGVSWGSEGYFKIAMYGNDPNKKYQNRFCQFEYPSVIISEDGVGLTGGVILITPGKIEETQVSPTPRPPRFFSPSDSKLVLKVGLLLLTIFMINKIPQYWLAAMIVLILII